MAFANLLLQCRLDVTEHLVRTLEQLCDDDLSRKKLVEAYDIAEIADLPKRHWTHSGQ